MELKTKIRKLVRKNFKKKRLAELLKVKFVKKKRNKKEQKGTISFLMQIHGSFPIISFNSSVKSFLTLLKSNSCIH